MNSKFDVMPIINGYKIIELIGVGGNSYVFKVKKNNSFFAMKIMKSILRGENLQRFNDEVNFQKKTRCDYIVKIIETGTTDVYTGTEIKQKRNYYVMNLYDSSFDKLINEEKDYIHLLKLYLNICNALKFIHNYSKKPIIHRDIKPQNMLYDKENDKLLLADFGIACFNKNHPIKTRDKKIGNFTYAAPEQRKLKDKKYGPYVVDPKSWTTNKI